MRNRFRHIFSLSILSVLIISSAQATVSAPSALPDSRTEIRKPSMIGYGHKAISHNERLQNPQLQEEVPQTASFSFSWNIPVGAAVFKRENKLWIVFDHLQNVDIDEIRQAANSLADEIFQFPHPAATVIRMNLKDGVNAFVRKEGLLWIVDLTTSDVPPVRDMNIYIQYDNFQNAYIFLPTENSGNIVSAIDPDIGDIITVAPLSDVGTGVDRPYHYAEFDMLDTRQGTAFIVKSQDIAINRGNSGLTIRAQNRGLNISNDLEAQKRRQRFAQAGSDLQTFNIKTSPQLLKMPYIDALDQLRQDIISAPDEKKNQARLELVKFFIAKGLGTNALYILHQIQDNNLPEANTEAFHALLGVANFLTFRYNEAIEDFEYGKLPENDEAVFWRTLASSAIHYQPENNLVLMSFIRLIQDYPQEIKDAIAVVAAQNALTANDDIATQNFIDILKTGTDRLRDRDAQIRYLSAQKLDMQGYPRNAIKEYRELENSNSQKYSSLARYENIILSQRINAMPLPEAISGLERLKFAWSEHQFKWKLLNKLADFYVRNNDYYNGIRTLQSAMPLTDEDGKKELINRMVNWFEDIYLNNQADTKISAVKSLALYQDFEWLSEISKNQNIIIQKLADRLVAVDLLPRARDLLQQLLKKTTLTEEERAKAGARLAVIHLFEKKPDLALSIIEETKSANLSQGLEAHRRVVKARTLADLDKTQEALNLLEEDYSKNALLLKSEIFWKAERWAEASDTIKYLITPPVKGKPLSDEQISFILDWATALKKAGRETVLVRLRNKFLPYFANTNYNSAFNVLTEHLERDTVDIRKINNIVNDVQTFSNFAKAYNESLKNTDLK